MKKTVADHIRALGPQWSTVLARATLAVKQDRRLVGLDKTRAALAQEAALRATGFPPTALGETFNLIVDEIMQAAIAKATGSAP